MIHTGCKICNTNFYNSLELKNRNHRFLKMYTEGMSTEGIAESYPITPRQIQRILKKHGVMRTKRESFLLAIERGRMTYDHMRLSDVEKKKRKTINPRLRFEILTRDKYTCQTCGEKAPKVRLQIDHKNNDPSNNTKNNLWSLCMECNYGKSDKVAL